MLICSHFVVAEVNNYGPRLEVGIGNSVSMMQSNPDWTSSLYYSGSLNYAYRIIYGLSVHGGVSLGLGASPGNEWYEYGAHEMINSEKGTMIDSSWLGARYEIPISLFKKDFYKINSLYLSGGLSSHDFRFNSKSQRYYKEEYGWRDGEIPQLSEDKRVYYRAAESKGYYIAAAARWRFDTKDTNENDSWLGSIGLDVGVRYNSYYDVETKYDNLMPAKSNFSNFQIFIVGFMKVKLLY
ncbi:hypothetical protein ACFL6K_03765 [Candidatus Latescibacterota bacterium]